MGLSELTFSGEINMTIVNCDCHKCTNKYTGFLDGKPATWCKPGVDEKRQFTCQKIPEVAKQ